MTLHVEINLDNDAFCEGRGPEEVNHILQTISAPGAISEKAGILSDINGNRVGKFWFD